MNLMAAKVSEKNENLRDIDKFRKILKFIA